MNPSLLGAGCPWLGRGRRVTQLTRTVTKPLTEAALGNEPTSLRNAGGPSLRLPQLWRLHEPRAPLEMEGGGGRVAGLLWETTTRQDGSHLPPCRGGRQLMVAGS